MKPSGPFDLSGRCALVSGAGSGIGGEIAVALAEAGAFVGVHYHSSRAGAEQTLERVQSAGGAGMILCGDLTDETQANSVVDQFVEKNGRLHILVNNAGALVGRATTEESSLDLWNQTMAVNLTSAFLLTRRAIPTLRASSGASIINIVSLSMQSGGTGGAGAYAVAKGALHIFTRTLARELGPAVRANAICPGVIETAHHIGHTSPEKLEEYRQTSLLKRNGHAREVALTAVYLASDASSFTTGAIIDVGGGRYLR
jgi:3-oxoacyl-[acyl-carrier protein] reductase